MLVKAIVEIPKNSTYKYEINKESNTLTLDRVLNQPIPENYGFISNPETLAPDGDALDVFIVSNGPLEPLSEVMVEIVCAYKCMDNGVSDDKLIGILVGEDIIANLGPIRTYLETYKSDFKVLKFVDEPEAVDIYMRSKV